ncbi:hypothetical protein DFH06DRAFT_1159574 [Mycena polygramma]|nr:hypothetical protein DFH06DRAFT_1159574 [Mycena polygramma]
MVAAPVPALAFGSYGDIVEAIKDAKAIIDLLRGVGQGSKERQAISLELASVVATADQLLQHLHKFPVPSPEYKELLNKVASEIVPFGSRILKQVHDSILWWQGANMFQKLRAAVSEREQLDKWRHYIDRFRSELTRLSTMLTLICSACQSAQLQGQLTSPSSEITRHLTLQLSEMNHRFDAQISAIMRLADASLPSEITPNAFYVKDPTGAVGIPFPLQYFRGFETLHELLLTYLGKDSPGSQYIQCGSVEYPAGGYPPSHDLRTRSLFDPATANYFIPLALSVSLDNFIHIDSFASFLYPDLPCSCTSVSVRHPLPSQFEQDIKLNSSSTRESFVIELSDCFTYSYTHLSHKSQSFIFSLRTANATCQTRVIGLLGLRRGSSRQWLGHPLVNVVGATCSPYTVFA